MRVVHPRALRNAAPPAVTVGRTTYRVASDGTVECPDARVTEIAERLAEVYDMTPDDLVYEEDGPPDGGARSDTDGCPFCDEYAGEHVANHAAQAHPERWDDFDN